MRASPTLLLLAVGTAAAAVALGNPTSSAVGDYHGHRSNHDSHNRHHRIDEPEDLLEIDMPDAPYFHAEGPDDHCEHVPEEVQVGNPLKETCLFHQAGDRVCVCAKKPKLVLYMMELMGFDLSDAHNEDTGYTRVCGKCHDPCALTWMPDMVRKKGFLEHHGQIIHSMVKVASFFAGREEKEHVHRKGDGHSDHEDDHGDHDYDHGDYDYHEEDAEDAEDHSEAEEDGDDQDYSF